MSYLLWSPGDSEIQQREFMSPNLDRSLPLNTYMRDSECWYRYAIGTPVKRFQIAPACWFPINLADLPKELRTLALLQGLQL
jgi:hypothetical protein